jgi:hypothetical protein
MVDLKFVESECYIIVRFSGKVELADIETYIAKLAQAQISCQPLNLLHDFRDTDEMLSPAEITHMLDLLRKPLSRFPKIKIATLHCKPSTTAISSIIKRRMNIRNVQYRIFSSFEQATTWLKILQFAQPQPQS